MHSKTFSYRNISCQTNLVAMWCFAGIFQFVLQGSAHYRSRAGTGIFHHGAPREEPTEGNLTVSKESIAQEDRGLLPSADGRGAQSHQTPPPVLPWPHIAAPVLALHCLGRALQSVLQAAARRRAVLLQLKDALCSPPYIVCSLILPLHSWMIQSAGKRKCCRVLCY